MKMKNVQNIKLRVSRREFRRLLTSVLIFQTNYSTSNMQIRTVIVPSAFLRAFHLSEALAGARIYMEYAFSQQQPKAQHNSPVIE